MDIGEELWIVIQPGEVAIRYCDRCKMFHIRPCCETFSEEALDYEGEEVDG